ncbi:MAG: response regulator transcription factor [Bdellovibrionales bacterium]|nr:response regulator transcription factor [Bdellovibrionales bacterium]
MTKHLLVIEDARDMQLMLCAALEDSYTITFADNISDAERFMKSVNFDLILLDVVLPDGTGFELCERMKGSAGSKNIPVIFLTGQTEVDQRVRGLKLGADDYVLKPFAQEELVARIESHLRRGEAQARTQTSFRVNGFRVDTETQKATAMMSDGSERDLDLTRIEFKLLVHFLRNLEKVFSRADLLRQVWGESTHVSEHTVDTHISSLRKKIGGSSGEIKAIVKQGYRFETAPKSN